MRLPWLQIDADGQTRARLLGRLLGVPETQGIGMAMALWTWALEMAPEGDFSGEVYGDVELVAAAVAWPVADAQRLLSELQRVGFVAAVPKLRVRGLDRYRRTWEKNRRKPKSATSGGAVPETGKNPLGPAPEPARKTETETERKELLAPEPKAKTPKPRKLSAAEEFFAWASARRLERTKNTDQSHTTAAVNAVFGRALVDVGRPQLEARYLAFLDEPDGASKEPPWPWRIFAGRWQTIKPSASRQRGPRTPSAEERKGLYDTQPPPKAA